MLEVPAYEGNSNIRESQSGQKIIRIRYKVRNFFGKVAVSPRKTPAISLNRCYQDT